MDFSFSETLRTLGPGAAMRIANGARPPGDYLFATLLPEMPDYDYDAESGSMTVRTTMAGLVGMDSPYPPGGVIEESTFKERTAKIAIHNYLPEHALRKLQALLMNLRLNGRPTNEQVQREALNFLNKVIVQSMLDTTEWLRGQALVTGAIDWTFNQKRLQVGYGVPAGNFLPNRTGTAAYGGSASVFWSDIAELQRLLRYNVRAFVTSTRLITAVLNNDANNKVRLVAQNGNSFRLRRYRGTIESDDTDSRYDVTLIAYDAEGEVLNPVNPDVTTLVPFHPYNKILAVGNNTQSGYRVGQGSTPDPALSNALGYTHLAPTVESGGTPGRWADLFTPEQQPWSLHGRGASNVLPVVEEPTKIAVASSDIS